MEEFTSPFELSMHPGTRCIELTSTPFQHYTQACLYDASDDCMLLQVLPKPWPLQDYSVVMPPRKRAAESAVFLSPSAGSFQDSLAYTVVIIVCTLASNPGEVMGCKDNNPALIPASLMI